MKAPPSFQLDSTPLEPGVTLIEASAGTGKTFTIAGLFLRLLLERNLSVREILVVTFTEAATEELRDRIRRTITEAAFALRHDSAGESSVATLLAPHREQAVTMLARLDRALSGFDEAPIFTIHGFCQRTLKDRAFESGTLFDTELLKDDTDLLQQVADDFWRVRFYQSPRLEVSCALADKFSPGTFFELLRTQSRHPQLRVIPALEDKPLTDAINALHAAFERVAKLWRTQRDAILQAFGSGEAWAKEDHRKPEQLEEAVQQAEQCFSDHGPTPESLDALKFFAQSSLADATRSKCETPAHPFFEACDAFNESRDSYAIALNLAFLSFAQAALPRRKQQLKVQTFDDLLTRLHRALHGTGGEALARQLRSRYHAALIDEFQDTDPVQYQNFRRIFVPSDDTAPSQLFLIGDPKQAIYGFRGADIFTYLDAAQAANRRFTLDRNWRSESRLVSAVNTLFSRVTQPFLFDEIAFQPVIAAGRADADPLTDANQSTAPLHFWFKRRETDAKTIPSTYAETELPRQVASEIVRLLNGAARIGERPVTPRDIAVLVRKRRQARWMQEALRNAGVPAVLHTEESVFESREATELCRILAALARPQDERRIRAALVTETLGFTGDQLNRLFADEQRWQTLLQEFHEEHTLWLARGFMAMFRRWLHRNGVRPRLLGREDGERRLTNLLHLAELLHQAAQERQLAPEPLVRWLEEQVSAAERSTEENQLRLERDDEAVRLVTIHKSKGLEYPIVFCPFSWSGAEADKRTSGGVRPVFFHRQTSDSTGRTSSEHVCDFESPDRAEHEALEFRERLAEDLRLLYVALTRARNRCYFIWGAFHKSGTSAAAWLLHPGSSTSQPQSSVLLSRFSELSDAQLLADMASLTQASVNAAGQPAIRLTEIPEASEERYRPGAASAQPLAARTFNATIRRDWRICSFSTLTRDLLDEAPDYDRSDFESSAVSQEDEPPSGIFAFPRGTAAGTCLHKVFEELDFTESNPDAIRRLVASTLNTHGFAAETYGDAVFATVRRTLDVPLEPDQSTLALRRIPRVDRLAELEFFFPIQRIAPALLAGGLTEFASLPDFAAQLRRLNFHASEGFLKGFIDLVFQYEGRFYIVDWKSNWLGNRAEDYHRVALEREMTAKLYPLQYLLYTVALHQYLTLRLPGYDYSTHFGGVLYLFLRGIDPARPELGVYRDKPEHDLIQQLSHALQTGKLVQTT